MSSANVNQPMDQAIKEQDIDRKLQLYGIASVLDANFTDAAPALQAGKVPSNKQIDIALNSFLASNALSNPSPNISTEGHTLISDVCEVVEQAKLLLLEKNRGNLLQDFLWQSQQIQVGNSVLPDAPVATDTVQKHGQQALDGIRTLGTLIISNGQFRKLLKDATIILRDIAGDTAHKVARYVSPSEEQLSRLDEPAAQNTWHKAQESGLKDNFGNNIKQNSSNKGGVNNSSSNSNKAKQAEFPQHPVQSQEQKNNSQSRSSLMSSFQDTNHLIRDRASEIVPEGIKKQINEQRKTGLDYLSTKLPEERREQTKSRLKKLVLECQEHEDYHHAITTLLNLAETYASYASSIGQQGNSSIRGALADDSLNRAKADLKILIERFANGASTKALFTIISTIYSDADKDPDLKNWLRQGNAYIRKCLQQKGFLVESKATDEWDFIFDRGEFLLRERYRSHTDQFINEVKLLAEQFDQDPQNKRFSQAMEKLFNDLGHDKNGRAKFKPQLIKDLTEVILPALFENIRYLPIPRIEYSDQTVDFVVENLVLESDNFFPNTFEFSNDNYFRWGRKGDTKRSNHSATLYVAGIQMDLKDVAFFLKKKKGFPAIHDIGVIDIFLGGSGFSFMIKMSTSDSKDRENFFKVESVDVDVKSFKIKIKQSQHKILFALAKPILLKVIQPALQKALELNIMENARSLDSKFYKIKLEVDRAAQEVQENPEDMKNIYQQYISAFQKQFFQSKENVKNASSGNMVKLAITKRDSLFPEINLPGGISSKATEYKELALAGDKWESPVFNLGSAPETQNIPNTPEVIHKNNSAISNDHGFC
ncbi:Uncharacterized protein C32A11.02c [Golovinomyces cichoracearum]|uniref:Uncharacterized protein C32A11.02c n=1 Tax=Golovinomyces cichoracearum TaxID=62708 RepID=A0A420IB90_9PEZI|nr:Uncharacterized protein C32A11.02c [Golovinomyces cichoracearum]